MNRTVKSLTAALGLAAGMGAGLAGYAFWLEPQNIRLEQVTLRLSGSCGRLPARGLRILHLSDSHFQGLDGREGAKIDRIRRLTQNLEYDLLVHTGDFLQTDAGIENNLALLDAVPAPRLGSYAVLGNHDYIRYEWREAIRYAWRNFLRWEANHRRRSYILSPTNFAQRLRRGLAFVLFLTDYPIDAKKSGMNDTRRLAQALTERGVRVLHNEAVHLNHTPDLDFYVAGVDDLYEGAPDLDRVLNAIPQTAPTLLLCHNPDILMWPGAQQAEVILSGHTHGGQIVMPFFGPLSAHSQVLTRHQVAGHLWRGRTQLFVSRGLGEGIPLRFGAAPMVALVTLLPEEAGS